MKHLRKKWVVLGLLVMILLTACTQAPVAEEGSFPGNKAYGFSLPDLTGQEVSLSAFEGKSVLVVFWASW